MQLVQITFHFEFWEKIEAILDEHRVAHFVRFRDVQGKDSEGKHYGSQVYPARSPWCRSRWRMRTLTVFSKRSTDFARNGRVTMEKLRSFAQKHPERWEHRALRKDAGFIYALHGYTSSETIFITVIEITFASWMVLRRAVRL